ncbi:glycosyltransferase involved in cell wall biosynthesis [Variovorax sp. GrIS 2.14]|uniref:glycosyltransferase family 4 protein n=1 Tax=Variovorax sp. GrIS 2.14 TaxID=3071709 RepID=UPI0038F68A2A
MVNVQADVAVDLCRPSLELGDPLEDPHFLNWAESPARNDHLSRYSRAILQLRPDLVSNFQDGRDSVGLMAWLRTSGLREMGLSRKLIERMGPTANASRMDANYVGYLRSHLGVGEAARNSVAALEAAGVVVFNHDISMEANAPMGDYSIVGLQWMSGTPAATILGCNADMLPAVLAKLPSELLTPYRIGCWYWETPEFPDRWVDRFDLVDEIWAGSQFIADAIRAKTTIPVLVMPPMVMPPQVVPNRAWLASQIPEVAPDEFLFMFQFDVASVPFRKNPEGVLAAFIKAFRPHEPVRLIVKTLNGYAAPEILDALRKSARGLRVSFMTETLESTERFRLLATIDSFVSLHRSEGFGLSIAEAMAYGVPVLATGWSGNVDFTHDGNAALVPFDLIRSKEAHGPYPLGTVWAEPRTDAAARLMRRMWTEPGWRKEIGKAGQRTINAQLSASVVGLAMRRRLDEVAGLRRGQRPASSAAKATQIGSPATDASAMLTSKLLKDMRRFPGYYAVRLHKVPVLMWKLGLDGTLNRARVIADSHIDLKDEYLVANLWDRLRKQLLRLRGGSRQLD